MAPQCLLLVLGVWTLLETTVKGIRVERVHIKLLRGTSGTVDAFKGCTNVTLLNQNLLSSRIIELSFQPDCEGQVYYSHYGSLEPKEFVTEFLAQTNQLAHIITIHFVVEENRDMKRIFRASGRVLILRPNQSLSTILNLHNCYARLLRPPRYRKLIGSCGGSLYEWQNCENLQDVQYAEQTDLDDFVLAIRQDKEVNVLIYLVEKLQPPEPSFASSLRVEMAPGILSAVRHNVLSTDDMAAYFRVRRSPSECSFCRANSRTKIKQFSQRDIDNLEVALLCDKLDESSAELLEMEMDLVNVLGHVSYERFVLTVSKTNYKADVSYEDVIVNGNSSAPFLVQGDKDDRFWTVDGLNRGILLREGASVDQFAANLALEYSSTTNIISTDNLVLQPDQQTFQFLVPIIVLPSNIYYYVNFQEFSVLIGRTTTLARNLINLPDPVFLGDLVFIVSKPLPASGEFLLEGKRSTSFSLQDVFSLKVSYRSSPAAKPGQEHILLVCSNSAFVTEVVTTVHYDHHLNDKSIPKKAKESDLQMKVGALGMAVERVPFERNHLHYEDSAAEGDSCPQDIFFKITSQLTDSASFSALNNNGKIADENGNALTEFTQKDINRGRVFYYPPPSVLDRLQPRSLSFEFSVADRSGNKVNNHKFYIYLDSVKIVKSVTKNITVSSTQLPPVIPLGMDIISPAYNVSKSRFILKDPPKHGTLRDLENNVLTVGDIFTFNELINGVIRYVASSKTLSEDAFKLVVYDYSSDNDQIHHSKYVSINVQLRVDNARSSHSDADRLDTTSWQLKVIEGGSKSIDMLGSRLVMVESPKHGRVIIGNSLSQQGKAGVTSVTYLHSGDEVGLFEESDSFTVQNEDETNTRVEVVISPVDNSPPVVILPLEPKVVESGNVSLGIEVEDRDSEHFTCDIDEQPNYGWVTSSKGFVLTFDEKLIDSLVYVQNLHAQLEPRRDSFSFTCKDSMNTSPRHTLTIEILPANDEQPYLSIDDITALEGKIAPVKIKVTDRDLPRDPLTFQLTKPPASGIIGLLKANGELQTVEEFTDDDIDRVAYQQDGSEVSFDSFELTVSDGIYSVAFTARVHVLAVDDELPHVVVNRGLELGPKDIKEISDKFLMAQDKDSPDERIHFVITRPPRHGKVVIDSEQTSRFTQEDIKDRRIKYRHTSRLCCFNDSFEFKVTDGYNTGPVQSFSIDVSAPDIEEESLKPKSISLSSIAFGFRSSSNYSAILTERDLNENGVDWLRVLQQPTNGELQFREDGGGTLLEYTLRQEAVDHLRTKDSFRVLLKNEVVMEKVYVSAEWCWLLLEIEDENNSFLGDGLNITLLRKGAASSVDTILVLGASRVPMSLDRGRATVSLDVEIPPPAGKDSEVVIQLLETRGCLAHPSTKRIIPKEKLRSALVFEHTRYTVQEPKDGKMTVYLKVSRNDRSSEPFRFTAVTSGSTGFPGSASSDADFEPLNQEFELVGSSRSLLIPLKIIGDDEQENEETFYVLLKDSHSRKTVAKTSVTIIDGEVSAHSPYLRFISAPTIISLQKEGHQSDTVAGYQQRHRYHSHATKHSVILNRGYPLQCITECDERHPHFAPTSSLCVALRTQEETLKSGGSTGQTSDGAGPLFLLLSFRWKWALHPSDPLEPLRMPPRFVANSLQPGRLESFLLVPGSRLSCSVRLQLAPKEGYLGRNRGEERESALYHISDKGVCPSRDTSKDGDTHGNKTMSARGTMEPYVSTLRLVERSSAPRFELSVSIAHQDGLLPLISTFPILKEDYTFSAPQIATLTRHPCSNFINISALHSTLSLTSCTWLFRREFSLEELNLKCGATVDIHSGGVAELTAAEADNDHASSLSNEEMQALESSTFMLSLPLHVAYLQRTPCPSNMATNSQLRWNHVSLSNVLQLSFLYNKPTFTTNAADPSQLTTSDLHDGASVEVDEVRLSADGILKVRFHSNHFLRTRGRLVLHRKKDLWNASTVWATSGSDKILFRIQLERTLSDSKMEWILYSQQPVIRFSGNVSVLMYPCLLSSDDSDETAEECQLATESRYLEFLIPIEISAVAESVDRYSLVSILSLTKHKDVWIQPYNRSVQDSNNKAGQKEAQNESTGSDGETEIFAKGDIVYGKVGVVLSLDAMTPMFRANIERCYLCSSIDESISTRLPLTGKPCADHSKMSCIFKILDSADPYSVDMSLGGTQFGAVMMSQDPTSFDPEVLDAVRVKQRADGFAFRVAPLFEHTAATNFHSQSELDNRMDGRNVTRTYWHVHCVFTVDHENDNGYQPSADSTRDRRSTTFGMRPRSSRLNRHSLSPTRVTRESFRDILKDQNEDDIREGSALLLLESYDGYLASLGSEGSGLWHLLVTSLQHSSSSPLPLLFFLFAGCILFLIILLLLLSAVRFAKRAPRYQPPLKTAGTTSPGAQIINANNNHQVVTMHVFGPCEEQSNGKLKISSPNGSQEKILYPPPSPQSSRHVALAESDPS